MALKLWLSAGAFVALTTHLVSFMSSFKFAYNIMFSISSRNGMQRTPQVCPADHADETFM
jgi:hypothetical protein